MLDHIEEREKIITQLQTDEDSLKSVVEETKEMVNLVSKNLKSIFNTTVTDSRASVNPLRWEGIPDALQAYSRLQSIVVDGTSKISSIRKLRSSILKEISSNKEDTSWLHVDEFL